MLLKNKIFKNAIWMILEKTISIVGLFLVTSYVAKYVGPSIFGVIALATATFQIIQIIAQFGNDNIIFKRISKNRNSGIQLIKSTFHIRTFTYIVLSIPTLWYFYSYRDEITFFFSMAICIACYFTSIDVYSIYNNAILKSKLNTITNVVGLCIGLSLQYIIAYNKLNPIFLSIPIIIVTLVPLCVRLFLFRREKYNKKIITFRFLIKYNKYIVTSGLSIVFSTLSIAIYTRVNQFLISFLENDHALGIYSVAVTLATAWAFILSALINSTLPTIFGEKSDSKSLNITANLNVIIIVISISVFIFINLFGEYLVNILFGSQYSRSGDILTILCLSTMVSNLGMVSARFIVRYSGYAFLSKKMFIVVMLSIPISYYMINRFGIIGAAYSVLIVELLSLTLLNYFFKNGLIFKLHRQTLNIPRILNELKNLKLQ